MDAELVIPDLNQFTSQPSTVSFEMEVKLPAVTTLLRADTGELMAVRESDPGAGYFARRWAWAQNPSDDNEHELRKAIRLYAAELNRKARGPQKRTFLGFASQRGRNAIDSSIGAAVALGASHLGIPTEFSILSGIGSAMASDTLVSALTVVADGPYIPKAKHALKIESVPELNLPT